MQSVVAVLWKEESDDDETERVVVLLESFVAVFLLAIAPVS